MSVTEVRAAVRPSSQRSEARPWAIERVEWVAVPVLLAVLIAGQIFVARAQSLLAKPFWLDEFHTILPANDPSLRHALEALAHGADTNAPGLLLLAKACVWGGGERAYRLMALGSVWLGLVGLYFYVRQVASPLVALASILAAWSHPLLIQHAFEARFYGPWFAGITWFAWALNASARRPGAWWPAAVVAATSGFVCTIHYFGIFSIALVAGTHVLLRARRLTVRELFRILAPVAFGPAALVGCVPFYRGQRASVSLATWIDPIRFNTVVVFLRDLFCHFLWVVPALAFFATATLAPRWLARREQREADADLAGWAGLAGLVAMPMVLLAFSLAVQPAMIPRYSIVAIAATGALLVPILARTHWLALAGCVVVLIGVSTVKLHSQARDGRKEAAKLERELQVLGRLEPGEIVYKRRERLYKPWWYAPDGIKARLRLWDPANPAGLVQNQLLLFDRDMHRNLVTWYGLTPFGGLEDLRERPRLYLVDFTADELAEIAAARPDLETHTVDAELAIEEVVVRRKP